MNLEDQYDRIYQYLFFHLHDRHAAEDLTQEVFLRSRDQRSVSDLKVCGVQETEKDPSKGQSRNGGGAG